MSQAQPPALVSVEWLHSQISEDSSKDICILDCSWSAAEDMQRAYRRKHIAGAAYLDILFGTSPTQSNPRPLPGADDIEEHLKVLGVNKDSHVILYDNNGNCGMFVASRAWWMLKYYGHTKVSVLDGGLAKWEQDGYKTTSAKTTKKEGDFKVTAVSTMMFTFDEMTSNRSTGTYTVVDTRPAKKYSGIRNDNTSGHYPGAVNIPFNVQLLDIKRGVTKEIDVVKQVLADHGVDLSKPTVAMCHCGMSSCILVLLAHILGHNIKLYLGGMVDWSTRCSDPADIITTTA